jgi:hypothetical protein
MNHEHEDIYGYEDEDVHEEDDYPRDNDPVFLGMLTVLARLARERGLTRLADLGDLPPYGSREWVDRFGPPKPGEPDFPGTAS